MNNIVIVGLGAIGSHVAQCLRNVAGLKLIDFDVVEQKNTLGQFHTKMSPRRNKAQALQQAFQGLWDIRVEVVPHKLTPENATQLLGGARLVLDCTDNIAARRVMMEFCGNNNIPLLHGAMAQTGDFGQVIWTDLFRPDAESGNGATCEDGENLPFHILMGSTMALSSKQFLDHGRRFSFSVSHSGVSRIG